MLSLDEKDIVQDDLWEKQQDILRANSERREQARKQLTQCKELNEALLKQEERRALAKMEQECQQLKQRRSVRHVVKNRHDDRGHVSVGDNVWFRRAIPESSKHKVNKNTNTQMLASSEMQTYENTVRGEYDYGARNPLKGADKVNLWLANSEDLTDIHETRSEPA